MSTTVRDASLVTKRNRNKAIHSYADTYKTLINSANPKQATVSPGATGAETVTEAKLGCIACHVYENELIRSGVLPGTPDNNLQLYPFNPSSGGANRTY
jgi:hypothetical protein